ncbi:glutathione S-transferase [Halioglobus japonicus]|uniref:Glutathione S-transferase n=1 Tax=Halioglobus japonicus TaxID=930805 RepID=A0AAP8MDD9_9GAMM|nr:glutathione S-transferase family protein [Halioglobus japonicus]PLW85737.1 glutathione S-transferase [Halioglobus japonicus]GHD17251.1 glutathione S-transferase [Halioglobus japonicus]
MKLYTYDPAPNPQRLALFLKYKGVEIETQQIDLMTQEQLGEAYTSIVPERTVPALVLDDGTLLTEVIGQCIYLESLYPEKPLLGTNAQERAQVISWDHKLFMSMFLGVAEVLRNTSKGFVDRAIPGPLNLPQIPELEARGRSRLEFGWQDMNRQLEGKTWLAGDSFSLADIDMAVIHGFSGWVKAQPGEELETVHAYLARVNAELGL